MVLQSPWKYHFVIIYLILRDPRIILLFDPLEFHGLCHTGFFDAGNDLVIIGLGSLDLKGGLRINTGKSILSDGSHISFDGNGF